MKKEKNEEQQVENKQDTPEVESAEQNADSSENCQEEPSKEKSEEDKTAKMTEEVAKWQDKYIRLSAEFDNYRKRTLKEKMDLVENGGADVLKSILNILDDMDRAVEANKKIEDIEIVRNGIEAIHKKLCDTLRQKGVVEIDAIGSDLDTDLHEAIAKFPVEEDNKKGKIIDVVQKGYKLKDKVLRYSKVVVGE